MRSEKIRRCAELQRAADTKISGVDSLTCAKRHVANEWEHDLNAWFSFGSEGLTVGADGNEGQDGLQCHISDGERLWKVGDRGAVDTECDDKGFVLSFGTAWLSSTDLFPQQNLGNESQVVLSIG